MGGTRPAPYHFGKDGRLAQNRSVSYRRNRNYGRQRIEMERRLLVGRGGAAGGAPGWGVDELQRLVAEVGVV